jgi:hypothetical protein
MTEKDPISEDLRKWFGTGGKGGVGGGGWDRYNTKGERIGKCARGPGEGKPKCLSREKAAKLRAQGGKKKIAAAVRRKREQDPVADRAGKGGAPIMVSNKIKKTEESVMKKIVELPLSEIKEGLTIIKNHGYKYTVEKIEDISNGLKLLVLSDHNGNEVLEYATQENIYNVHEEQLNEKEGPLGKVQRTPGGPKKFMVKVKDPSTGNVKTVRFGDPNMEIKRDDPERRSNFRARHNCDNPGPKTKARYWSCRQWRAGAKVEDNFTPDHGEEISEKSEKDHEHSMARSQLSTIKKAVEKLMKKVQGEGQLEAWVQSKITKAADYIDTASDYMESGEGEDIKEGKLYDRLVSQLLARGMSKDRAHATATAQLQKSGSFKPGTRELTKHGEKRQSMGAAGRAKDRAAKRSGRKPSEYKYNPKTNGATLKSHFEPDGQELEEKNVLTNPSLWSRAKSLAKQKFDVYPSAYANGWAAKWYKSKGGGWKKG